MSDQPMTAARLAPRVKELLESADLEALAGVLDPEVHWGAPDDPEQSCTNRGEVLAWWARARATGVRATVTEVSTHGDRLLVGLQVQGRPGGEGDGMRWQVLTVSGGGVLEIVGYDDRDEALARAAITG